MPGDDYSGEVKCDKEKGRQGEGARGELEL